MRAREGWMRTGFAAFSRLSTGAAERPHHGKAKPDALWRTLKDCGDEYFARCLRSERGGPPVFPDDEMGPWYRWLLLPGKAAPTCALILLMSPVTRFQLSENTAWLRLPMFEARLMQPMLIR